MKKLKLNSTLNKKCDNYSPYEVIVEKVITLYGDSFEKLKHDALRSNPYIKENKDLMYTDKGNIAHCILLVDSNTGDGILVNSEGKDYALKSQFIPNAKALIMQNEITETEFNVHNELKKLAQRIAERAHTGNEIFTLDELEFEIYSDAELFSVIAEMLEQRDDINEVILPEQCMDESEMEIKAKPHEKMKFICPLKIQKESPYETEWDEIYDGDMEEISPSEAIYYDDVINAKIESYTEPCERNRGLMAYYDKDRLGSEKFFSAKPKVEVINGELMGVFECQVCGEPTKAEINEVRSFLTGQASDGFGEGFEQREIAVSDHDNIYVSFWDGGDDWSMQTDEEFFGQEVKNEPTMSM